MKINDLVINHALGIDFGTSNSYFSDVRVGGKQLSYTDLKFHNGHSSLPTCVLYENVDGDWKTCAFGDAALELWKALLEEEREHYRFRGGFKPDLAFEKEAYEDTVAFFESVRQYLVDQRVITHFSPEGGRQVVVGVPARNVEGQREKTLAALEEAGIFGAQLVPEPEGALIYHLYYDRERITVDNAHRGVIVIDFGGGTFDVAYLQDGDIKDCWGNPMLGGRLFDDLFYQWFMERNGGASLRRQMKADGTLEYLRTFGFRRLKERFSNAWANDQMRRFRERLTVGVDYDYGVFREVTVDEFLERARHYKASQELLADLDLLSDPSADFLRKGEVDLFGLIQEQMKPALQTLSEVESAEVAALVLTGGSCRWPFMREIVAEAFPDAEVFQSPDPEATISRGLALSFAFREYAKDVRDRLQDHLPELQRQVFEDLHFSYRSFIRRVAERFTSELYQAEIRPSFEEWRNKGGTIRDLENAAEGVSKGYFQGPGKKVIEQEKVRMQEQVEHLINQHLFAWLRKYDITRADFLSLADLQQMHDENLAIQSGIGKLMDSFFETIGLIITGIISLVIASLAGGGGVALLMSGPIGWMMGLVLGAATAVMVLGSVDTKDIKISPYILKMAATDERLRKAQESFKKDIEDNLMKVFDEREPEMRGELNQRIADLVIQLSQTIPVTAIIETK